MKDETSRPPPDRTPFQRFTDFAKRLMSVPKSEIDEQAREYEQRKRERQCKGRRHSPRS